MRGSSSINSLIKTRQLLRVPQENLGERKGAGQFFNENLVNAKLIRDKAVVYDLRRKTWRKTIIISLKEGSKQSSS